MSETLKERLLRDMKEALKAKDVTLKDTIQIVRAGVLQIEKDTKTQLDDAGVTEVISKEVRKRLDVLPDYERGGRDDLVAAANRQIEILRGYLPEQLTESEISRIIDEAIEEAGASSIKDMGKVMKTVTPRISGRADGKTVSEMVKSKLSVL